MIGYLRGSASGMLAQQLRVDAVADNLANVNTIGHKATRIDFQDLTYRNISPTGQYKNITDPKTLSHIQLGIGVGVANTTSDLSQGNISQTGGPFDLAIVGEGYFMVELANGSAAYTRDGTFRIDSGGRLVSESGGIALPQVTLPPDASDPWVSTEGIIYARIGGADEPTQIGEL